MFGLVGMSQWDMKPIFIDWVIGWAVRGRYVGGASCHLRVIGNELLWTSCQGTSWRSAKRCAPWSFLHQKQTTFPPVAWTRRQYEELRRSIKATGYGVEAGFFDLVGDKKVSKLFQAVKKLILVWNYLHQSKEGKDKKDLFQNICFKNINQYLFCVWNELAHLCPLL